MAEIRWTKESYLWLKDIYDYIALDNPKAASRVVEGIFYKVQALKRMPEMGYRYYRCEDQNIRILLYGHYRIVYRLNPTADVDVLGIFHGSLDIDKYCF